MICSQAGIPTQMASKAFQDAFTAKYGEVKQYAPFFYDGANILIAAMQKADSTDPAKYLPEMAKISFDGATGHVEFDAKGDRKDAEMTIFQMKNGKVDPVAIIKAGKTTKVGADAGAAAATTAPAAAPAAPAAAPAAPAAAPAAPMSKDAPKK
jgi:branched-chain amino acid transport system substrate-binding protein